jgi:hypothetical protein
MFDIALANSVLELFGKLVGFIDRGAKNRKDFFDRTCQPLFAQLEILAKEYHATIQRAFFQLAKPDPNLDAIGDELEVDRGAIIIAREGILGRAATLRDHYDPAKPDEFADAMRSFAQAVVDYFFVEIETGATGITTLTEQIRGDFYNDSNEKVRGLRENSQSILLGLEAGWKEIAKRFERVRLYCETGRS